MLVAPPVPWGVSHYHHVFPGTLSLTVESLSSLLLDLCRSVATNGFTRMVLLNGHGGNSATIETVATRAEGDDPTLVIEPTDEDLVAAAVQSAAATPADESPTLDLSATAAADTPAAAPATPKGRKR